MANKKNTKKFTPSYTVDMRNVKSVNDLKLAFAGAKFEANQPLNVDDVMVIIESVIDTTIDGIFSGYNCVVKHEDGSFEPLTAVPAPTRQGYFKRLWKALLGK